MPQYLVIAYDGTDPEAPARRQAARPAHLEFVRPMVEKGELVAGGAILDEEGRMIGSAVFVDFPDRAALDAWLERDPYVTGGVWQRIEVKPFRLAVLTAQQKAG
jgi:uncharacterized protein YciI